MEVEIYGYKEILLFPFLCVTKATFLHRNDENENFSSLSNVVHKWSLEDENFLGL